MEELTFEIKKHKDKLNNLIEKMKSTEDLDQIYLINNEIKVHQEFLDSLLKISKNITLTNNTTQLNKDEIKINKDKDESEEKKDIKKSKNNRNSKSKHKDKRSKTFDKNKNDILNINDVDAENDKNFYFYHKNTDLLTKYIRQVKNRQTIYFQCSKKRNGCSGAVKFNLKTKIWNILHECNIKIKHDTCTFEYFYEKF